MKLPINTCLIAALVFGLCVANGRYLLVQVDSDVETREGTDCNSFSCRPTRRNSGEQNDAVTCIDTNGGKTDLGGDGCDFYHDYPRECGDFDDFDFTATSLCCACGGGSAVRNRGGCCRYCSDGIHCCEHCS